MLAQGHWDSSSGGTNRPSATSQHQPYSRSTDHLAQPLRHTETMALTMCPGAPDPSLRQGESAAFSLGGTGVVSAAFGGDITAA
jgi:hypothetical protein